MKKLICKTPTCTGVTSSRSKSGLCSKCRSSLYYWGQHRDRIHRRSAQLKFWQGRLNFFVNKVLGRKGG